MHSALLLPSHYSLLLLFTTLPVALKRDPAVVFDPNNLHHVPVGTAASSARHASAYLGLTASMSTLSHGTKPTRLSYYLARCLHCTTGWVNCANESSQAALERASQDAYDVTGRSKAAVWTTRAAPAMKPEATAIGDPQDGRWKITLMFDGRRFCIPKFTSSSRPVMSLTCRLL